MEKSVATSVPSLMRSPTIKSQKSVTWSESDSSWSCGGRRRPSWHRQRSYNAERSLSSDINTECFELRRWNHRKYHRILSRSGKSRVTVVNVQKKVKDLFTALLDCRWRYTLLLFYLAHLGSWLFFAMLWYLLAAAHGDLPGQDPNGGRPCVSNMTDFTTYFVFSVESQTTIGYGTGYPSNECPLALLLLFWQTITGILITAVSVGTVLTKTIRPERRALTLLFSRNATICTRDGFLALQFRVADIRKSPIVSATLSVHLRCAKTTLEGDVLDLDQKELGVVFDGSSRGLHLMWPTNVIHRIDEKSPLYSWSAKDVLECPFELLVFLEGTIQATGQTAQAKTSYSKSDILWGHKFVPMIRYNVDLNHYTANFDNFQRTVLVPTPKCSALQIDERIRKEDSAQPGVK